MLKIIIFLVTWFYVGCLIDGCELTLPKLITFGVGYYVMGVLLDIRDGLRKANK